MTKVSYALNNLSVTKQMFSESDEQVEESEKKGFDCPLLPFRAHLLSISSILWLVNLAASYSLCFEVQVILTADTVLALQK